MYKDEQLLQNTLNISTHDKRNCQRATTLPKPIYNFKFYTTNKSAKEENYTYLHRLGLNAASCKNPVFHLLPFLPYINIHIEKYSVCASTNVYNY